MAAAAVVSARAVGDVTAFIRGDWPTMFFPIYTFLGERLRALDIPGWNPYQFSGAPFIGDPSSGWMYLPAMLFYALLPAEPATGLFIAFHIILSAIAAYVLARLTGLVPAGALVAGAAFAFPWLVPAAAGSVLMMQVTTWLPIVLIGVELARGQSTPWRRLGGLALAGVAISHILAAWLGQAAYYALLVTGGWVAWRTLVTPPRGWSLRQRFLGLFGIGGGILLIGFALNAASLLVRLDANARSNTAGGVYTGISGWADTKLGRPWEDIARALAGGFSLAAWQYAGAAVLALALLAPFVAFRWPPLVYWLIVPAVAMLLTLPEQNAVQTAAYALLPRFELLHVHLPDRILMVVPLSAAMLAGATTDALARGLSPRRWGQIAGLLGIVALAAAAVAMRQTDTISTGSLASALAALAIAAVAVVLPAATRPALLALSLAVVILWDPVGRALIVGWGPGAGPQRSLHGALGDEIDAFLYENGAATFLAEATRDEPGRYAGYDPAVLPDPEEFGDLPPQVYRNQWLGPANWLLVHNWGMWFGIDDVQGYNPIHVRRYGEYIDALNGHRQEYHETNIFPAGLDSPLLNPLNLRYFIVPAAGSEAPENDGLAELLATMPTVYDDAHVRILENADAFPRAWLVHEARQAATGEILPLLADGAVDPAQVALLEGPPPPLEPVPTAAALPTVTRAEPDRLTLAVTAEAPGLLMLSEVWDPGWSARVNGEAVPTYQANYVFLALPVPAGQHTVELRYTPPHLWLGLAISLGTALALVVAGVILYRRDRPVPPAPSALEPGAPAPTASVSRPARLASAALMVAIPAALIIATWEPLEPVPRARRASAIEQQHPHG